ncbi:MAG: metallophosphoesterase family protein [Thermoplasmata archaeon]
MPSRSFVFAHLADAHVGAWSRDPAVRQALRESLLAAFRVVEERDCAFLLISGDLFHTPVPEPGEVAPVASALRRLVAQGRRVYVIYGSHDYVAHRTSWLDVLAETGIFLKSAPEPVRSEGDRFSLSFHVDEPTGAVIAGLSGRAHGLDSGLFRSVDSEAFRAAPGFHIFQFHAAVREYLPKHLREHIHGISRDDLPGGCDYYAGGHIHFTYTGTGPDGGLLINPGAVFGTSTTDVENASLGKTHQGLVIVRVTDGVPEPEFVDTAPRGQIRVFGVDVDGKTPEEARIVVRDRLSEESRPGAILFPRLRGTLAEGTSRTLGLPEATRDAGGTGASGVHWDLDGVQHAEDRNPALGRTESEIEEEVFRRLSEAAPSEFPELAGPEGLHRLHELVGELGQPRGEGEARQDYLAARLEGALRLLKVRARSGRFSPGGMETP